LNVAFPTLNPPCETQSDTDFCRVGSTIFSGPRGVPPFDMVAEELKARNRDPEWGATPKPEQVSSTAPPSRELGPRNLAAAYLSRSGLTDAKAQDAGMSSKLRLVTPAACAGAVAVAINGVTSPSREAATTEVKRVDFMATPDGWGAGIRRRRLSLREA
jgi:hypothetical protein